VPLNELAVLVQAPERELEPAYQATAWQLAA
jgi:hypothetical protein